MITVKKNEEDIKQSLYYYLNHEIFSGTGLGSVYDGKILKNHYSDPQLDIVVGFPDSLQNMELPTIALVSNPTTPTVDLSYDRQIRESIYSFSIYGFCGGTQSDALNKLQRDRLKNDIKTILEDVEYINLYTYPDFTNERGDIEISNIAVRNIEETGPLVVERYRFVIDFNASLIKDDYYEQ